MILNQGERIEDLQCGGLKVIQDKNLYTFTCDSAILANFISLRKNEIALEIGCGCGVISILLSKKVKFKKIYAVEIQSQMASLALRNVEINGLQDKIEIINDDILLFNKYFKKGEFDAIFSNPPYMLSTGDKNSNEVRNIARHDFSLPLDKFCEITSSLLKEGGRLYVVYTATRTAELIYKLKKERLEPKKMFFTQNGKGKIKLVVIEAVKGGHEGIKVLPELVTNEETGQYKPDNYYTNDQD